LFGFDSRQKSVTDGIDWAITIIGHLQTVFGLNKLVHQLFCHTGLLKDIEDLS